jgi:hypothetical protein
MKIKTTHSSPNASDVDGAQPKSPRPVRARFPLVITSSGTPHPTSRNRKLTRKTGRGLYRAKLVTRVVTWCFVVSL